jgi:hypothetical protein
MKHQAVVNLPAAVSNGTFTRIYKSAAQFDAVRLALGVLGGIVLALALDVTANAQTAALRQSTSQGSLQASKEALAQSGCAQNGKLNAADLLAMLDKGTVPSCLGNIPLSSAVAAGSTTDPTVIKFLAALGYIWGLGPEYIERFSLYNTILYAPFNALKYGAVPSAWNNEGTNAGDASVVYFSGFLNFQQVPEQVFTVPPSENSYYVVAYYDAYAETIGSIGTRTTSSSTPTSFLLVGPNSPYANQQHATINGHDYPVMASDTNVGWILTRVLANTLIDASASTSVPNTVNNILHKFALNSLAQFEGNNYQPVYPKSFTLPPPTQAQIQAAQPYQDLPTKATDFFTQLGNAVMTSPIPSQSTGLSGTPLAALPTWVAPQYGATTTYVVPSSGQNPILALFAPIGLTQNGFQVPAAWGPAQMLALQEGYVEGQLLLAEFIQVASSSSGSSTHYWGIVNDIVGTYPSNLLGYLYRSLIVVKGGVANIGLDAIYPTLQENPATLDGNNTYQLMFTPPTSPQTLTADGIYPPMVPDSNGNPKGFWSVTVYQPDSDEAAAPFIAQTSVLNTSYSTADTAVLSVNPATNFMMVKAPNWGMLVQSTPILFGTNAAAFGLKPNTVYYVATPPTMPHSGTYTFQISETWKQDLSHDGVPIQNSGNPGPIVQLISPTSGTLNYGMVKPVTQLGSSQLVAGQLVKNADGSLTLWFGPTLPTGAPISNWIPTPSTAYYSTIYKQPVSTTFQLTLRMYYPTPGNDPPSILPCTQACGPKMLRESYKPPPLK